MGLDQTVSDVSHDVLVVLLDLEGLFEVEHGVLGFLDAHQGSPHHFVVLIGRGGLDEVQVTLGEVSSVFQVLEVDVCHELAGLGKVGVLVVHIPQNVQRLLYFPEFDHDLCIGHQNLYLEVRTGPLGNGLVDEVFGLLRLFVDGEGLGQVQIRFAS